MDDKIRIGREIAAMRKENKISQAKLAELTGVDSGHIARIELGRYSVGVETLSKIAKAFGKEIKFV